MVSIKKLLSSYQKGDIEFNSIITYFSKTVNNISLKFKSNIYVSDINSYLWEISSQIKVDNFNCDKALYMYIHRALYIYCLSNCDNCKKIKIIFNSDITDITLKSTKYCSELNSSIIFDNLISTLPKRQKDIVSLRYKYRFSDTEIAECLDISRQAVYKNRKNALSKITKSLSQ